MRKSSYKEPHLYTLIKTNIYYLLWKVCINTKTSLIIIEVFEGRLYNARLNIAKLYDSQEVLRNARNEFIHTYQNK